MAENWDKSSTSGGGGDKQKRKIRFLPLPTAPKMELSIHQDKVWSPLRGMRVRTSIWLWIAILLLFISNVLYAVAFLTNGWGLLMVDPSNAPPEGTGGSSTTYSSLEGIIGPHAGDLSRSDPVFRLDTQSAELFTEGEKYWEFGLWECCRNDGFCLGTRWPAFYSATRAFAVLGLFGHILTLAWLVGHALENLLEYDPCTVVALIALNISTAIFVLISTVVFGTRWPQEFGQDFNGHSTSLSYSFYLAVTCVLLTTASSVFSILDFVVTLRSLAMFQRDSWVTADEILGDEDEIDNIEDKSWAKLTTAI